MVQYKKYALMALIFLAMGILIWWGTRSRKVYDSSGYLLVEESMFFSWNHGESRGYSSSGDTVLIETYKFGQKQGPYRSYYSTGHLQEIGRFDNGERVGEFREYHSNGLLKAIHNYSTQKHVEFDTLGRLSMQWIENDTGIGSYYKEYADTMGVISLEMPVIVSKTANQCYKITLPYTWAENTAIRFTFGDLDERYQFSDSLFTVASDTNFIEVCEVPKGRSLSGSLQELDEATGEVLTTIKKHDFVDVEEGYLWLVGRYQGFSESNIMDGSE